MATAQLTTAAFVEVLGARGLLEPPQLGELTQNTALLATDPHRLAFLLLQQGWLTPYQVNRILAGRSHELVLGHYVLQERLGEGGMAQVFKARHRMINRVVALKVIRPDQLNNRDTLARFRREMRSVAQLSHPNIVGALDADEVNGTHFFVMEFVDGVDLGRLVKRSGPLAVAQTCDYIRQAACGLAHAHEKGLIHRDIKPTNLIVTTRPTGDAGSDPHPWGLVKLLDMGLARSQTPENAEESAMVTHAGQVIGTPDFLAPEQAADAKVADIRADIYSLGGTTYFLLTGQVPFPGGSTIDKLVRQRFEEPTPANEFRPEVPAGLADLVRRMLAKNPADRPQTPSEVVERFRRWCVASGETPIIHTGRPSAAELAAETLVPAPATVSTRVRTARRRWNATVAAGVACLVASLGLLTFLLGRDSRAPANRPKVDDPLQPFVAQADKPSCDFAQLRTELTAFRSLHRGTPLANRADELLRQLPSAFDSLAASKVPRPLRFPVHPAELVAILGDGRLRHWSKATAVASDPNGKFLVSGGEDRQIYVWEAATGKRLHSYTGHTGAISGLAIGREGKFIASASHDQTVRLWDSASQKEIASLKHPSPVLGVAISPNGKQLAAVTRGQHGASGGAIHLWDVGQRKEKFVLNGHGGPVHAVAYSPDGRTVASGGEDRTIRLWDVGGGTGIATLGGHQGPVLALTFVKDGNTLASGSADKTLRLWDVPGRKERHRARGHSQAVSAVAAIPGGTLVAAGDHEGVIKLWDTASANDRGTYRGHSGPVASLAVSPDGQKLLSAGHDRSLRIWDVASQRDTTPGDPEPILALALSPDDRLLATGHCGGKVCLRNPVTMHEQAVLEGHQRGVSALAFSPDGRLLASGGWDNQVVLWNAASGKSRFHLNGHSAPVTAVAFGPDGRVLVTASHDKTAKLWDTSSGRERATLAGHREGVSTAVIAPDGRSVATGSFDRQIRLWDTATAKERAILPEFHGESLVFTSAGKSLAGGSEHGTIRLWKTKPNASVADGTLPGVRLFWPRALAVSSDGTLLAVGGVDGQVLILNLTHNQEVRRLHFPGAVLALAFAGDGRHLLSANGNGTVAVVRLFPSPAQARRPVATRSLPSQGR